MKKSKLAAEIKFLKFCRKQHKAKLNELVRVIKEQADDIKYLKRRVETLELKLELCKRSRG